MATNVVSALHTTAESHNRIMVCEIMGNKAGWLTLYSGIAGSADIILLPEIPYDIDSVCSAVVKRAQKGKAFSILAVAEGVFDTEMAKKMKQNSITSSYSSPPEVFFNGKKIAKIQLNGDNQKIKLPKASIKPDDVNEIVIQTGVNLFQKARLDYDDIELMNISIQSE
jgi:6-phosphofructokinase 1